MTLFRTGKIQVCQCACLCVDCIMLILESSSVVIFFYHEYSSEGMRTYSVLQCMVLV